LVRLDLSVERGTGLRFARYFLSEVRGTGPLPLPASHRVYSMGGREGERAGAALDRKVESDRRLRPEVALVTF
jgi:hypothetical protein